MKNSSPAGGCDTQLPDVQTDTLKRWQKITICVSVCLMMLAGVTILFITKRAVDIYGNTALDQILFHCKLPSGTIHPDLVTYFLRWKYVTNAFLVVTGAYFLFSILLCSDRLSRHYCRALYAIGKHRFLLPFIISLLVLSYALLEFIVRFDVAHSLIAMHQRSTLIDEVYVHYDLDQFKQLDANGQPFPADQRPNLILIVSESMEQTFTNADKFGKNLIGELTGLQTFGDHIDDLIQVKGCHYTMASMYSVQYGLPLLYLSASDSMIDEGPRVHTNLFRKNCVSFLDVLNANGYSIIHLQGTDLKFAGQGDLFSHFPNARVIGVNEISTEEIPDRQPWGLWDKDLFEKAKRELAGVTGQGKPFFLSLQTIDTHTGNTLQPGADNEFGDARDIICLQSKLISEFVAWTQQQPWGKNTVVVILGDHNMMTNHVGPADLTDPTDRRVYNCILNSKNGKKLVSHKAAEFDFAPTILDAMGFRWPSHSFGIGRSLYSESPTLLDEVGVTTWNAEAAKHSDLYMRLICD